MIASDHDRRLNRSILHEVVDPLSEAGAFAITQPTDPCRQSLKSDFLSRKAYPSTQCFVFWKQFQHEIVGNRDVARVSRERCPAKWSAAFREHRADVGRYKAREVVCVPNAALVSHRPDVV